MKIKGRILIIIAIFSTVFFLAGIITLHYFFMGFVESQEKSEIQEKCRSLWIYNNMQISSLDSTVCDWAKWDDTYHFILQPNDDYVESNLNKGTVSGLGLSFMIFTDSAGKSVKRLYYDKESGLFLDFPSTLQKDIETGMETKIAAFPSTALSGIIYSGGKFYFVSGTSVSDSTMKKPPDGTLVIGTEIDNGIISDMEEVTGNTINLFKPAKLDPATLTELNSLPDDKNGMRVFSESVDGNDIAAYSVVSEPWQNINIVARMTENRVIYRSGVVQFEIMSSLFLVLIVMIMIILFRTLDAHVSRPVANLASQLASIRLPNIKFQRLPLSGKGEILTLRQAINGLLDNIEHNYGELNKREQQFSSLVDKMNQGFAVFEIVQGENGNVTDFKYIYTNDTYLKITGLENADVIGKTALQLQPGVGQIWLKRCRRVAIDGRPVHIEQFDKISGKYLDLNAYRPQPRQVAVLLSDITERRLIAAEREYASYHDQLTGLYNRRYFDEAMKRMDTPENLPLSIIIADMNGLKFTNDAFGHETGDKLLVAVAEILRRYRRGGGVVARWGGDEFTILLPETSQKTASAICAKIKDSISRLVIHSMHYTISLGCDTKCRQQEDLFATLRHAEDFMYRRKAMENHGRGHAIEAILTTFKEKNKREKEHSDRVSALCKLLGKAVGFSDEEAEDLGIAGLVHDIGKIAINDAVINKRSRLSEEEWAEVKRHPEIGYRILCASNEMREIADYILAHHERWDGAGYPKGLAGCDIPLQSRILAIADSYDAITSERPYKPKMNEIEAAAEIARCSGSQFDPVLAKIFVEKVLCQAWVGEWEQIDLAVCAKAEGVVTRI